MQLNYSATPNAGFPGMKVNTTLDQVDSAAAQSAIGFGLGVVRADADKSLVRLPCRNHATIVFSADLITSNVVNGTINGVAIAAVTFATNHLTTMGLLKDAVEDVLDGLEIEYTVTVGGASNRTLTIDVEDETILLATFAVTAGVSQATVTLAHSSNDTFEGIALHEYKERSSDEDAYAATETVNVMRKGKAFVTVNAAVEIGDAAYLDAATLTEEGQFTNVSTNNLATGGRFTSDAADGEIAELEINLP